MDESNLDESHDDVSNSEPTPTISEGYDVLAEKADGDDLDSANSPWGDSYFQRHYAWPATEAVLPDVADDRVLLAGCGRGDHVDWFLERGAEVVGVDASEAAVRTARERFDDADRATFRTADVTEPLDFEDGTFDLAFSNLALSHVEEWAPTFAELRRVLSSGGTLAFATIHPLYLRDAGGVTYYETTGFTNEWSDANLPTYYRPMGAVVDALVSSGFRIEAFEEPGPREAFREHHPDRYEAALADPELLVVRARCD